MIGPAAWPAIITPAERDRILARMTARSVTKTRAPRTYLLSGMLRCGRCGNRLFSQARHNNPTNRVRRYVCLKGPDHGGCGRLTVVAQPVEELLTDAVLTRLDSPQLADALNGKARVDADVAALAAQLEADQARLDELAALYAEGAVTAREWIAARDPITNRITQTRRDIAKATDTSSIVDLVGTGNALRGQWDGLDIDRQQAIIKSVLDHAVIAPGTPAPAASTSTASSQFGVCRSRFCRAGTTVANCSRLDPCDNPAGVRLAISSFMPGVLVNGDRRCRLSIGSQRAHCADQSWRPVRHDQP
ncbi:recombinase zinc beta ribbon domain protein [Mycobacterium kansasii]|uniref:Recombinase zinc beta ribbon domain protein n=1 Tax=Mycobacterium kansasii TaxID=1768 RepID=A0A1V3WJZ8_MYCKA|nr:recombinase zinc beta ribbon domain protein [Mycobacterium kansasii]